MNDKEIIIQNLIEKAIEAKGRAYCPYSDFPVGAALYFEDGTIFQGCNVENASYGGTICAERTAMGAAVAAGYRKPLLAAVISKLDDAIPPCGICRQFLIEFNPELELYLCSNDGKYVVKNLAELIPSGFDPSKLK